MPISPDNSSAVLNTGPMPLSAREFSELSIGKGSEARAASYVKFTMKISEKKRRVGGGTSTDASMTSSACQWKAVLNNA